MEERKSPLKPIFNWLDERMDRIEKIQITFKEWEYISALIADSVTLSDYVERICVKQDVKKENTPELDKP